MRVSASLRPRLTIDVSDTGNGRWSFSADVLKGLSANPKRLDPMYFYDDRGSALFESICRLPEYYVTRIEREILARCADEISSYSSGDMSLVEFGSGNSEKTRLLIEALIRRQGELVYIPIDISFSVVALSAHRLVGEYPRLSVAAQIAEYRAGLSHLANKNAGQKLIVFMGSNLGNFDPVQALDFMASVRKAMSGDDYLMIGNDLAKDPSVLIPAYDDPQGVTAAFNLNLLERINRELGGDFDTSFFRHLALYNSGRGRIEMYLESRRRQTVRINNLCMSFPFEEGESIHTENSYKYTTEQLDALFRDAGFRMVKRWQDARNWFSVTLLGAGNAGVSPAELWKKQSTWP